MPTHLIIYRGLLVTRLTLMQQYLEQGKFACYDKLAHGTLREFDQDTSDFLYPAVVRNMLCGLTDTDHLAVPLRLKEALEYARTLLDKA